MMLFNRKFNARVFAGRPATDLMRYDVSILVFRIIATGLCLLFIAVCRWLVKQANRKFFRPSMLTPAFFCRPTAFDAHGAFRSSMLDFLHDVCGRSTSSPAVGYLGSGNPRKLLLFLAALFCCLWAPL